MASSEFYILESCKNPGQRIIAQYDNRRVEVFQNEKQLGDIVALESKDNFLANAEKGEIKPVTIFVYNSSNDTIAGCFTVVDQTQTEGYDYYINPGLGGEFKNCGDCQYQLGVENISSVDTIKKAEGSKIILAQIIDKI
jgi:hypothetical protein